jgi:hypothetical protein
MPRTAPPTQIGDCQAIPTLHEPRSSQSLERGLVILGCFTPEKPVLGIPDVADDLGMSRSTGAGLLSMRRLAGSEKQRFRSGKAAE